MTQSAKPLDKEKKRIEEQIFFNIMKIVQEYPQYSVAQHLAHVLRSKGKYPPFYQWTDEQLLKHFEDYRDELDLELALRRTNDMDGLINAMWGQA